MSAGRLILDFAEDYVLLGSHGLRPRIDPDGVLTAFRDDGSTLRCVLPSPTGPRPVPVLVAADGAELAGGHRARDEAGGIALAMLELHRSHRPGLRAARAGRTAPSSETQRLLLAAMYALALRYLASLADDGAHGYLEEGRIYCEIGESLTVDIALDDTSMDLWDLSIRQGSWVVFITDTRTGAHQARLEVPCVEDPDEDGFRLAEAVGKGLAAALAEPVAAD